MQEILESITNFNNEYGPVLGSVILPRLHFDLYGIQLKQRFPHITFEGDDIDGIILVQREEE